MPATDFEQLMLEYINDARLNPMLNAARYINSYTPLTSPHADIQNALTFFNVSGSSLLSAYQALAPVQPLAWNDTIATAARSHSQLMITNDSQSHQLPGEAALGTRITNAGYSWSSLGENIYAYTQNALHGHAGFMVDWGAGPGGMQNPAGHRNSIMNANFREAGIGVLADTNTAGTNVTGPWVVTQDFGRPSSNNNVFLLGVAYADSDSNNFYSMGEGRGTLGVTIQGGGSTTSAASGGYTLSTTASGAQTIQLTGGGLASTETITANLTLGSNYKIDVVNGNTILTTLSGTYSGPATKIVALGVIGLGLTGGTSGEQIIGNDGSDTLNGGGGNDTLTGGGGSDTLDGGTGADAALFAGARANYTLRSAFSNGSFVTSIADAAGTDGSDALINIEALGFNGSAYGLRGVQQNLMSNMDGQRYDDVLFQNSSTGQVIYQNMTAGTGGGFLNLLLGTPTGFKAFSSGDVSGDGRAETFLHDASTGTIYAYNTAPGATAWTSITTGFTSNFQPIATGDVTRDGVADFLVRNTTTGEVFVGDINAGGTFGGFTAMPNVGTGWRTVGLGDFNADGASDILIQNIADGTTYYRDMINNTWGVVSTALGATWIAKEAADMNGDGYCDVIFRNTGTGNIWYRDMLGGTGGTWGVVANGLTGWDVRNTADVDNDGYRDVIIQNTTDGTTYYADMNNGVFNTFGVVTSAVGTQWLVV